jgi:hypothetical protein
MSREINAKTLCTVGGAPMCVVVSLAMAVYTIYFLRTRFTLIGLIKAVATFTVFFNKQI